MFKKIHLANLKHPEGSKSQNKTNNELKKIYIAKYDEREREMRLKRSNFVFKI